MSLTDRRKSGIFGSNFQRPDGTIGAIVGPIRVSVDVFRSVLDSAFGGFPKVHFLLGCKQDGTIEASPAGPLASLHPNRKQQG